MYYILIEYKIYYILIEYKIYYILIEYKIHYMLLVLSCKNIDVHAFIFSFYPLHAAKLRILFVNVSISVDLGI